jgi:hypothetical protein
MKYFVRIVLVTAFFTSCSGQAERSEEATDSVTDTAVAIDSVPMANDSLPADLIAAALDGDVIVPSNASLILYTFGNKLSENKNRMLSAQEVRRRYTPMDPVCDEEAAWTFHRFFYLDSLEKIGEEPDHDMGQTVKVEIREYDTIRKTSTETWVVWTMYYETEQACPYATGTYYMLSTYDASGKIVSTQCMGRNCGGADAPVQWTSVQQSNIFSDGSFRGLLCDTSGDYSEEKPDLAIMRRTFTGRIAPGGKITTVVKEIERND